jgi:hypothetical protein
MSGIRQWELQRAAAALTSTMPDLCDVYRRTGNRDRFGGGSEEAVVHTDVPIGVSPAQGAGPAVTGVESDVVVYNVVLPLGTFIREGDILEVTTLGGLRVAVTAVQRGESYDSMVRAQAARVDSAVIA